MSGGADLADAAARRRRSPARPDIRARHAAVGVRRAIAIACILGCLAGGGRRAHAEEVPGADALADAFVAMAGGSEYGARAEGIVRWEVPLLEIAVIGAPTQDQRAALGALLPQLTAATGLGIEEVPPLAAPRASGASAALPLDLEATDTVVRMLPGGPGHGLRPFVMFGRGDTFFVWRAHMHVLFTDRRGISVLGRALRIPEALQAAVDAGSTPCYAHFGIDKASHVLRFAFVLLRTDLPDWTRRRCLHEEITQSLGLRNDIEGSSITLFDDQPMRRRTELTRYDLMFLSVLYDLRLSPGLAGPELRARARALIAERLGAPAR
jgi:hypothetical protein